LTTIIVLTFVKNQLIIIIIGERHTFVKNIFYIKKLINYILNMFRHFFTNVLLMKFMLTLILSII